MFGHDDTQVAQGGTDAGMSIPDVTPAADTAGQTTFTAGAAAPAANEQPAETVTAGAAMPAPAPAAVPATDTSDDELLSIKQQALQQLSPLVGHLEQSPEEKFRTTMMMIQASDNQGLIKEAYAAAQEIDDEKTRAQALLDIVNEINYFTQHQAQ